MSVSGKMSLPLLRAVSVRSFSAQSKPAPAASASHAGFVSTVLSNKTFVATNDNGATSARISIAYKAGSRYEPSNELGLTHVLRSAAGLSTTGSSSFAIIRNLQQLGANLTATVDRETIVYTLEASKAHLEDAVKFLNDVASRQTFRPWELPEALNRVKYEISGLAPQVRCLDLLHKAAYRRGLGNSIFCAPRQVGKISPESLQHYIAENYTAGRCAVAGYGLPLDRVVAIAQTLSLPEGSGKPDTPSPYKSGEMRKEMGGDLAHVAIAVEGASLANPKEALALAILSRAVASGPQVKWGADNSVLGKVIASEAPGSPFAANGFNLSYSDSGIFGILISAPGDSAGKVVQAAGKMIKSGIASIGADALKKGRAQLTTEILSAQDTGSILVDSLAIQGLLTGTMKKPSEIADEINKMTDSDITNVAGKISRGKVSMGAAGALSTVPYIDEI
ncbi:ubiquinol-cytochrome c reductase core protein 2 [Arctopsyche grandis]|uniref:ubiquinol-cytochrome c reductase core protein 2 n=1 Tax=Arctopsyche grandis TaxID=121162 RepID=UPI00406D8497